MNLAALRAKAERRLSTPSRSLTLAVLAGDTFKAGRMRYRMLAALPLQEYVEPGAILELHRSLMPNCSDWSMWTRVPVDRITADCISFYVPSFGRMPMPRGDFVGSVIRGWAREPRDEWVGEEPVQ